MPSEADLKQGIVPIHPVEARLLNQAGFPWSPFPAVTCSDDDYRHFLYCNPSIVHNILFPLVETRQSPDFLPDLFREKEERYE